MSYIKKELLIADILDAKIKNVREDSRDVLNIFERMVERQPDVDVAEVRHGEWKRDKKFNPYCSVCDENPWSALVAENNLKYCPNCGAKMDK